MSKVVIIIDESDTENVSNILNNHRIEYHLAGYPNGRVKVIESYNSKMNIKKSNKRSSKDHTNMVKFAKQLGYSDISEAIKENGSGANFRRKFKKEFTKN